jgi:hypothetical protein
MLKLHGIARNGDEQQSLKKHRLTGTKRAMERIISGSPVEVIVRIIRSTVTVTDDVEI